MGTLAGRSFAVLDCAADLTEPRLNPRPATRGTTGEGARSAAEEDALASSGATPVIM